MRLDEVALIRWGGFTDRRIAFEPGARLHVVLGANEAGKTTLLRGVRDLLFGIERGTSFDFLHAMPSLLLGGVVSDGTGRRLGFQRRKGLKNTLLDGEGRPLPDAALAPWLGDVDKRLFESFFGLDHQTMRAGGEAMLQAQGDVGSTLFAASSGLRDLIQVRRALDDEADALFGRRRRNDRVFYQALDRLEGAQDVVRRASLHPDKWHQLERDGNEARERQRQAEAETRTVRRHRDRLEALRRAAPLLRDIDRLAAELADLADAPVLPEDFEIRVTVTQTELTTALAVHAQRELTLDGLETEREGAALDQALLAAAPLVEAVHSRIGAWPDQVADIQKLRRDCRLLEDEIAAALVEIGEAADAAGPGEAEAMVLRGLVTRRTALVTRRDEAAERLDAASRDERRLAARAADSLAVGRPLAPQKRLDQVLRHGDVDEAARDAARTARDRRQAMDEARGRLGLAEPAASLPVPGLAAVEPFAGRAAALAESRRDSERHIADLGQAVAALERQRAELAAGRDIPTPERVDAARRHRDQGWTLVRRLHVERDSGAADAAARWAGPGALADAFEDAVWRADGLADRRDAEAERVARDGQLARDLDSRRAALAEAEGARRSLDADQDAEALRWQALWRPAGIAPADPRAMLDWLRGFQDFLRLREQFAQAEADRDRRTRLRDEARAELAALLAELGADADDAPTATLVARAAALIEQADEAARRHEQSAAQWREARERIEAERATLAKAAAALSEWEEGWRRALDQAHLPADIGPESVEHRLHRWGELRGLRVRLADKRRRLGGLRDLVEAFEREVADLAVRLGADPADRPERIVALLYGRLTEARRAEVALRALDERIAETRRGRDETRATIGHCRSILAALHEAAGAADADDLPQRVRRARQRASAEAALAERRRDLPPGRDIDETRRELAAEGLDDEAMGAEIDRLGDRQEEIGRELAEIAGRLRDTEAEMAALRQGADAAAAAQRAEDAVAELGGVARDWMRLKAAGLLLARSIERFRAAAQDPLVRRAAEIFGAVTVGAYQGLAVDFDQDDRPVLVGLDRDGSRCPVARMSDGTRDQLYLALRIAAVERHVDESGPMPFLADDLFINWDDARTEAGVAALAALGARTQVILLTHHRAVLESAHRRLDPADLNVTILA